MSELATTTARPGGEIIEAVVTKGDLARLTPEEKTRYYVEVCRSVGLNPFTKPLEYIQLSGRLTLYAKREAADQLRQIHGISLEIVSQRTEGDLLVVHVRARDKAGRQDEDFGAVSIAGLKGEARANAMLKGITKAKRRVTLSIAGLGFLDETEIEDFPAAQKEPVSVAVDLDAFVAAEQPPAPDDRETARIVAQQGTGAFRAWWQAVPRERREKLREHLADYEELAKAADRLSDATEPPPPVTDHLADLLGEVPADDGLYIPLPRNPTESDLDYFGRQLIAAIAEEPENSQRRARLKAENESGIAKLKKSLPDLYNEVMREFAQR
jgi:hypothetical protein